MRLLPIFTSIGAFGVEAEAYSRFSSRFYPNSSLLWPVRCFKKALQGGEMRPVRTERRKWSRLPLAIPVFVRSRDPEGKEFLEFATALNVSAGGMLVAVRRVMPPVSEIQLEIPSAPLSAVALIPNASRDLRAKTLRTTPAEGYYLLGLKFSRPLLRSSESNGSHRRKATSPV